MVLEVSGDALDVHRLPKPRTPVSTADSEGVGRCTTNRRRTVRWAKRYRAVLLAVDCLIGLTAGSVLIGLTDDSVLIAQRTPQVPSLEALFLFALPFVWPVAQAVGSSYSPHLLGNGSEEFRTVVRGGLFLLAAVSVVSYGAQLHLARSVVIFAVPVMTVVTLMARYTARKVLHRARLRGRCVKRVVAVGRAASVEDL